MTQIDLIWSLVWGWKMTITLHGSHVTLPVIKCHSRYINIEKINIEDLKS